MVTVRDGGSSLLGEIAGFSRWIIYVSFLPAARCIAEEALSLF
jgi:hypothetical protein